MKNTKIIYQTPNGVAIISPAHDSGLTVEQIAQKDVPHGLPYKIITNDDLPSSIEFMPSWEIDLSLLNDGVGADYGVGSTNAVIGWNVDGSPILRNDS